MVVFLEAALRVGLFCVLLKLPFSKVFVAIQNAFCVEQVAAVFCAVCCVNTVPHHAQNGCLMGGVEVGGKYPFSNFCLVLGNSSIDIGGEPG